ncbi:MAG: thioredoxin domain-containing protein [Myxococcota bacterium]
MIRWVLVAMVMVGCVDTEATGRLEEGQKRIEARLDTLLKQRPTQRAAQARDPGPDPKKVYRFPIKKAHTKGPKDAWVTIVEISDFQCPFCSRVGSTMERILKEYGDDVRVAWKHNPLSFHRRAFAAALGAECAGEQSSQAFWRYHDVLFANQRQLEDSELASYASKIEVDLSRWRTCYAEQKYKQKIIDDQRTAMKLGVRGTPGFFVNGRFLRGAKPYEEFSALIDEELEKAKKSGISRDAYYEQLASR